MECVRQANWSLGVPALTSHTPVTRTSSPCAVAGAGISSRDDRHSASRPAAPCVPPHADVQLAIAAFPLTWVKSRMFGRGLRTDALGFSYLNRLSTDAHHGFSVDDYNSHIAHLIVAISMGVIQCLMVI